MLPLFSKGKACCLYLARRKRAASKGNHEKSPTFPNINETVFHIYLYFNNKEHDIKDIFIDSVAFLPTIEHFFAFLTKSSMMKIMKARLSN